MLETRFDVAVALGVTEAHLLSVLYGAKLRKKYRQFMIHKRSGKFREISAPPVALLLLQKRVLRLLESSYNPKACVHGFVKVRNIVSNARNHVLRRHLVNVDLRDFFPSIHIGRVIGVLQRPPYDFGRQAAETIAQICCRDDGQLPQGGVTSPILANLVCRGLDTDLIEFARRTDRARTKDDSV